MIVPNLRKNLSKEVSSLIIEMIRNNKYEPGSKLPNEMELSKMFNVSRTTIREAIKSLASNNIVKIIRGKGTFVAEKPGLVNDPLGVSFIRDNNIIVSLFETRLLIEPKVAYLAAQRATAEEITKLESILTSMEVVIANKENHRDIDIEFHTNIAKATQNPIIERIIPIVIESIMEGYYETVNVPGSAHKALQYHYKIFRAIKAKDPYGAEKAMKDHLNETLKDIGILEKQKGGFKL
nr:FadR/GntR family transcriptional regulator [Tepidanaerobacter sp. GT38]